MTDRADIVLREARGSGPKNLPAQVKTEIEGLRRATSGLQHQGWLRRTMQFLFDKGKGFVGAKVGQEEAKVENIRSEVFARLEGLDIERNKLLEEREIHAQENETKLYELRTERLKAIVDRLIRLRELGVDVRLDAVAERLMNNLEDDARS